MSEFTPEEKGGTMRLGARTTVFRENDNSVISKIHQALQLHFIIHSSTTSIEQLYGHQSSIKERHRHRYEVNPDYVEELQRHGLQFVATDDEG